MIRPSCLLITLVSVIIVSQVSCVVSDKVLRAQTRQDRIQKTLAGEAETADELKKLLSAAIEARGGHEKLRSLKDSHSVSSIIYGDVYKTRVLYTKWTMEPDYFRQDMIRNGRIISSQQYDGKRLIESSGQRVRFGLEKNLETLQENVELNKILSLLPIGSERFPARLCGKTLHEGRGMQAVEVRAPSGLVYRVYFDDRTYLITKLEYVERIGYAQGREVHPTITYIDSYRAVDGVWVADRLRITSHGLLKAEVRLLEHEFNVGLKPEFFNVDRLKQDIAASPVRRRKITTGAVLQHEWKESALYKISELLQKNRDCRFSEVTSYGDPRIYRERFFETELTLVLEPAYLQSGDALAFYTELIPAPTGFYEDCIVLNEPPKNTSVTAKILLHEMTHAIIRRKQEEAPLLTSDDEFLTYYQSGLFHLGSLLRSFERIAFDVKQAAEPGMASEAKRIWCDARRNWQNNLNRNRMTPGVLKQFKEWCGVDFDLNKVRAHYIDRGVDKEWMPMAVDCRVSCNPSIYFFPRRILRKITAPTGNNRNAR